MKVVSFVGGRANLIKVAPVHQALIAANIQHLILDIGVIKKTYGMQTYKDLQLPFPDVILDIDTSQSFSYLMSLQIISTAVRKALDQLGNIDLMLVYGDLTSGVAASIAALQENIPLVHVEAGLRNDDINDIEEINRLLLDRIARWLFPPSAYARDILVEKEQTNPDKIFMAGNTIIAALRTHLNLRRENLLKMHNLAPRSYALVTLHREENLRSKERFCQLIQGIINVSTKITVVFIQYPETIQAFQKHSCPDVQHYGIVTLDTLPYHDYLGLLYNARLVISDSSGIQDETTFLGIPCFTCRNATHRHETITIGSNTLVPANARELFNVAADLLEGSSKMNSRYPPEWEIDFQSEIIKAFMSISKQIKLR